MSYPVKKENEIPISYALSIHCNAIHCQLHLSIESIWMQYFELTYVLFSQRTQSRLQWPVKWTVAFWTWLEDAADAVPD